ncbi:MAG: aminotransferase class IV [Henriciella sp.]|jgi:branched-chain amino acid aminotransferase
MNRIEQDATDQNAVLFDLSDRGLLLGDGVFDTSLVIDGQMVQRDLHVARLLRDAQAIGLDVSPDRLAQFTAEALAPDANGAFRITITRGPAPRGLDLSASVRPTLLSKLSPINPDIQHAPTALMTSVIRRNSTSPTSLHKTLAYMDNILARHAAVQNGFDDALFLNEKGKVCCATSGNLFFAIGDKLVTPPVLDGALPGTVRAWLFDKAAQIGLGLVEASLPLEEAKAAEFVLMTNSLRLFSPVTKIDGATFPGQLPAAFKLASRLMLEKG